MTQPLSERKEKILTVLKRYPEGVGFNEFCRQVKGFAAGQTVKNELDELIRLDLVGKQASRKGQKVFYFYNDETAKSISEELKSLSHLLEGLKSDISQIEEKMGKPLSAITREDAGHPALLMLIRHIDSIAHIALIISLVEWRYPAKLRDRFKVIEQPFEELVENFSRVIQLNSKLLKEYCDYVRRVKNTGSKGGTRSAFWQNR